MEMSESIFCRSEKKEKRHAGRHHRRPARGRRDRGPGEDLVSDFGGGEQRWCDTEAAMRALAVLEQRLTALVPPGTSASPNPVDQRALFDVLSELASVLHRGVSSLHEVTQSQRGLEDALLRITCGGWAGPAVRNAAANTMCVLFLVGNQVGLFSAVSELAAVAFGETKTQKGLFKKKNQDANTTPLKAGLTPVAHARVSALDTLQRLARSGHAPTMRGAGSGIVERCVLLALRIPPCSSFFLFHGESGKGRASHASQQGGLGSARNERRETDPLFYSSKAPRNFCAFGPPRPR